MLNSGNDPMKLPAQHWLCHSDCITHLIFHELETGFVYRRCNVSMINNFCELDLCAHWQNVLCIHIRSPKFTPRLKPCVGRQSHQFLGLCNIVRGYLKFPAVGWFVIVLATSSLCNLTCSDHIPVDKLLHFAYIRQGCNIRQLLRLSGGCCGWGRNEPSACLPVHIAHNVPQLHPILLQLLRLLLMLSLDLSAMGKMANTL